MEGLLMCKIMRKVVNATGETIKFKSHDGCITCLGNPAGCHSWSNALPELSGFET